MVDLREYMLDLHVIWMNQQKNQNSILALTDLWEVILTVMMMAEL